MRLRDVLYAAGLLGGVSALALALSTHRQLSALNSARQSGGVEAARAAQAYEEFGQVQLLGFYALAILMFAMFLIVVFSRNEKKRVESMQRVKHVESPRVVAVPEPVKIAEEPIAKPVEEGAELPALKIESEAPAVVAQETKV